MLTDNYVVRSVQAHFQMRGVISPAQAMKEIGVTQFGG